MHAAPPPLAVTGNLPLVNPERQRRAGLPAGDPQTASARAAERPCSQRPVSWADTSPARADPPNRYFLAL